MDAESIGSFKRAALIRECIKNKIPYFIVITKIDLLKDPKELEEIKEFLQKEYKAEESKIIPISTINSSYSKELQFLEDKIKEFTKGFKSVNRKEAEYGFLKLISKRLLVLLKDLENLLFDIQKRVDSFYLYIDNVSSIISKNIQIEIEEFSKRILLQNRKEPIVKDIGIMLLNTNGNITEDQLLGIITKQLGVDFLEFANNKIKTELYLMMQEQWNAHLNEIKGKSISVFNDFVGNNSANIPSLSLSKFGDYDIYIDQITKKAFSRGMKGTLGFAGILTAYAAWFGPAAAAVTLPMALTGVGLPIAVVGAGISSILAYKKRNQTKDMINLYAADIIDNVVIKIVQDVIMPEISYQITSLNKKFSNEIKSRFFNENILGMNDKINFKSIHQLSEQLESINT